MTRSFTDGHDLDLPFARQILQRVPAVIYVYDVQARRSLFQNRHLTELLGHPDDDTSEQSEWQRLIHPDDAARFPEHRERLTAIGPRETLSWEYRMQAADGDWRWFMSRDVLLSPDDSGKPWLIVGSATDISEQKDIERRKDLLAGEMRHRSRNFSAIVSALAHQSRPKRPEDGVAAFDAFAARLQAILNAGDVVLASESRSAACHHVLRAAIAPLVADMSRVEMDGPEVTLGEQCAGGLALVTHELTTNALKYGALSNEDGKVEVVWTVESAGPKPLLRFLWRESDGPPVVVPKFNGFGTRLLKTALRCDDVALRFAPEGFSYEVLFNPH